jgi:predicted nucleic acid-binding protein
VNLFFDTNLLVAISDEAHPNFNEAARIYEGSKRASLYCAAHSLAEFYAVSTRVPTPSRLSPRQSMDVIEDLLPDLSPVTLTAAEYLSTIRHVAGLGLPGGIVYDALLIACARKCKADVIYTFNQRHFTRIAPDLADRIRKP